MRLSYIHQLEQIDIYDIPVVSTSVKVVDTTQDLGVITDSQVSLSAHVALLCRAGHCQLCLPVTTSQRYYSGTESTALCDSSICGALEVHLLTFMFQNTNDTA